jgi:hypothetical protein
MGVYAAPPSGYAGHVGGGAQPGMTPQEAAAAAAASAAHAQAMADRAAALAAQHAGLQSPNGAGGGQVRPGNRRTMASHAKCTDMSS